MLQNVYPNKLKEEIQNCIDLNKPMWKDVSKFIARLSIEAANCQSYVIQKQARYPNPKTDGLEPTAKDKDEKPLCLWKPNCDRGIQHKMAECGDCPKDEKAKFYGTLRKSKNDKNKIKRMKNAEIFHKIAM